MSNISRRGFLSLLGTLALVAKVPIGTTSEAVAAADAIAALPDEVDVLSSVFLLDPQSNKKTNLGLVDMLTSTMSGLPPIPNFNQPTPLTFRRPYISVDLRSTNMERMALDRLMDHALTSGTYLPQTLNVQTTLVPLFNNDALESVNFEFSGVYPHILEGRLDGTIRLEVSYDTLNIKRINLC